MLKKNFIVVMAFVLTASVSFAQGKFYTKTGKISFLSKAPIEEIEGKNKTVTAVLDSKTGAMQFAVQMKGFEFERALMQEHFNENYMESDKYPKATFKGKMLEHPDLTHDGMYPVTVMGDFEVHGVKQNRTINGTVKISGGVVTMNSEFMVKCEDHHIVIPQVVFHNIAQSIRIRVAATYTAFNGQSK